jgi:Glyoxalase-like domain
VSFPLRSTLPCFAHRPTTLGCLEIDHVLLATRDLAEAARELEARHGLRSIAGGRHPGWGTENRIVPLGDAYLELVAVANLAEARDSAFGQWVARAGFHVLRPLGWAVRPGDLDDVALRQGLAVTSGARVTPTGERLAWRTAGVDRAAAEPSLPFFIEWEPGSRFPGSADTDAQARLIRLVLEGDPSRLASWLGGHALPLEVGLGAPEVVAVTVRTPAGETVVEAMG